MICPGCRNETSEMMTRCEWCGASLFEAGRPVGGGAPPGDQAYEQNGQPPSGGFGPGPEPFAGPPPSEWRPMAPAGGRPPGGGETRDPWYMSPWPYAVAILALLVAVGAVFLLKGKASSYPDLVVGGQATLLDFYTDT